MSDRCAIAAAHIVDDVSTLLGSFRVHISLLAGAARRLTHMHACMHRTCCIHAMHPNSLNLFHNHFRLPILRAVMSLPVSCRRWIASLVVDFIGNLDDLLRLRVRKRERKSYQPRVRRLRPRVVARRPRSPRSAAATAPPPCAALTKPYSAGGLARGFQEEDGRRIRYDTPQHHLKRIDKR